MPKKLKGGTLWDFSTSVLSENSKKIEGGPLGKKFFSEKSLTEPKILYVPLVPVSFLDDVKILLRKLLKYFFKFAK